MFISLAGPYDLAVVLIVIVFATLVLLRGQRSVHVKLGNVEATISEEVKPKLEEVASAVNNVQLDEPPLIEQIRKINKSLIGFETTIEGFGQRLTVIGLKADRANKQAEKSQKIIEDYVHEQSIIESAVARGLLDRRKPGA